MPRKKKAEKPAKKKTAQQAKEHDEKTIEQKELQYPVPTIFAEAKIIGDASEAAHKLYNQSRYGTILENDKLQFSLIEGLYLMEKGKIEVYDRRRHKLTFEEYVRKAKQREKNFWVRYAVFKDFRNRGYIIKTALKFGADFRVYDRGIKPGEDHAKWVVFPVHEGDTLTWYEFSAKNRVAHSTRKRLLIGVVDDENDVTYYEIRWMRP